jgi:hypothetical protein
MTGMRLVETHDQRAKLGESKPLRDLPAQYAPLGVQPPRAALAGNDKHEGEAIARRVLQKLQKGSICPRLRHAMQVDPGIDIFPSSGQLRSLAAGERRRLRAIESVHFFD